MMKYNIATLIATSARLRKRRIGRRTAGTAAKVLNIRGGIGLIVCGAVGYGISGWALGVSIWGMWEGTHGHRNP
jgi:hypothetical protein